MPLFSIRDLRPGDIVVGHGMRILLDKPVTVYGEDYGNEDPVYYWDGKVLNADDICDPAHPEYDKYIARWLRPDRWKEGHLLRDRWQFSGNQRDTWRTEAREDPPFTRSTPSPLPQKERVR